MEHTGLRNRTYWGELLHFFFYKMVTGHRLSKHQYLNDVQFTLFWSMLTNEGLVGIACLLKEI